MQPESDSMMQQQEPPAENGSAVNGRANGTSADPGALLNILHSVKQCQQQRVRQYTAFNASFRHFLESRDETPYRQAMVEATRVFAEVNEAVRSQELRLRQDLHDNTLADSLAALQKGEEAKLRFTLIQQALKQSANEGRFSWQNSHSDASSLPGDSHASPPAQGSHQEATEPHSCCGAVAEPTEQEFNNALAEATQELQAAVTSINDILAELQEVEVDLDGEM